MTTRRRGQAPAVLYDLEPLPNDESLSLLYAWAGQHAGTTTTSGSGQSTTTDDDATTELVSLLGGLPLALYLVGRFLACCRHQASEFVAWLREAGLNGLHFEQRPSDSIPLLLEQSLAQVSGAARDAFAVVGILAQAPFDREPIAKGMAVSTAAAGISLGELVDYGLLLRPTDAPSYQVTHTLAHAYARTLSAPNAEAVRRLAEYYIDFARTQSEKGPIGFAALDPHRRHIVAVQQAAFQAGNWDDVQQIAWEVDDYLDLQGHATDPAAVMQAGLDAARVAGCSDDEGAFSTLLGTAYAALGQTRRAIELYTRQLEISRELKDTVREGMALSNLGRAHIDIGETSRGIQLCEEALAINIAKGATAVAGDLGNLGFAYAAWGDLNRALEIFRQRLAVARENGEPRQESDALCSMGLAFANLGDFEHAIDLLEGGLRIERELGDRKGEGSTLRSLGRALAEAGELDNGIAHCQQSLAIQLAMGDQIGKGEALDNLGYVFHLAGDHDRAFDLLHQALALLEDSSALQPLCLALVDIAEAYLACKDARAACVHAQRAVQLGAESNYRLRLAAALWTLARLKI